MGSVGRYGASIAHPAATAVARERRPSYRAPVTNLAVPQASRPAPQVAAATDVGRHREHNEDTYLVRADLGIIAVADGMGGHEAGDVASALAVEAMQAFFQEGVDAPIDEDLIDASDAMLPKAAVRLLAGIRRANRDVHTASIEKAAHRGMGSTVVALHVPAEGDVAYVGHVGDSRCYRIRDGAIELLTQDHSLINEARAIDPTLTDEELARLPSNIITRALGLEPQVKVDLRIVELRPSDVFLLCSDGLSGIVSSREMIEAVRLAADLEEASELLIALANDGGGFDNITAVLVAPKP
jgi:protein phosphatase